MTEALLEIANIVGTHGLRGDLKARLKSDNSDFLMTTKKICLRLPTGETLNLNVSRQALHKGQVLLRLQGYDSIDQAEKLVGSQILLAENLLPNLSDGEYYWGQLKGLQVIDRGRGEIGRLQQLISTAAHDTYVVKGAFGEILIPAVHQFILNVDLEAGVMQVDLPEGLIAEEQ
ncbi:MAG: 16S rRNA processing protein RimM [Desulfuromusa sp.]|nr:16S rRNA processing protein RimM [Desulfuromusa sp.]